jgi:hypothetical protein
MCSKYLELRLHRRRSDSRGKAQVTPRSTAKASALQRNGAIHATELRLALHPMTMFVSVVPDLRLVLPLTNGASVTAGALLHIRVGTPEQMQNAVCTL